MPDIFSASDTRRVQVLRVGHERQPVLIIDDFLAHPEALVDFAAGANFVTPKNWYPGLRAEPLPQPYVMEIIRALHTLIGENFELPSEGDVNVNTYFGLATMPPDSLSVLQRLPHFDTSNPRQVAVLHYLCDGAHGGTSFYRHRSTGYETVGESRQRLYYERLNAEAGAATPPARYMSGDDALYEETARIEAKFNRLAIYRSCALHSANVESGRLNRDPRLGRLTANIFLAYR
jgi:hypothetical protein